ncbi:MAG: BlaI/MecI/CopY family transcriptional regulator [Bacteroidales bacterium]|nr:BlaI/MecI/CopY family transcriptional regulator [Bacteroidales bacterium]
MNKNIIKPTESELKILKVIWEKGPVTVKAVNEELSFESEKEVGYTTTLKLMQIMAEKGLLTRLKNGRMHIYDSAIQQKDTQKLMLDKLLQNLYSGSASNLVMQALGNHKTSKDELDKIKNYIKKLEEEEK